MPVTPTVENRLVYAVWIAFASIGLMVLPLWAVPGANASSASLVKAKGKRTLVVIGQKGEENRIHIQTEKNRKFFTLSDTGQLPDYSTVTLRYAAGSLPGCQVRSMGDATTDYLRCRVSAVHRVFLDLRDQDDLVQNGDGILAWTVLPRSIEARLGGGADIFNGGPRNDKAIGGAGNDILKGWGGNDMLDGGAGADSIAGDGDYSFNPPRGGGNDLLFGGGSADHIHPGSGRDRVFAGAGNDIVGSAIDKDRDVLNCGAGRRDSLLGANNRGIRLKEKAISGCETIGSGHFGKVWSCTKRRCVVHRSLAFRSR